MGRTLLKKLKYKYYWYLSILRMQLALAKGAQSRQEADPEIPATWEYSVFSQNGEDGIINFLLSMCKKKNRYFVEIGAADGLENNSANLAIVRKFSGIMVEGDPASSWRSKILGEFNMGVDHLNTFVTLKSLPDIIRRMRYPDPDFLSIDIDGNDYWILNAFLNCQVRPKIICVEYNSTYGPEKSVTIPYQENFYFKSANPSGLYYGASVNAFRKLMAGNGYKFVTVDFNGVNAFFVDPTYFEAGFLDKIKSLQFADNFFDVKRWEQSWVNRLPSISHHPLTEI